ncbi:MAG: alpha-amylase [Lachnospiraceae bacterium]|nr:alpha-amylase [Lachnospiraceae bacterium]
MGKTYRFTHVSENENCGVILYDKKTMQETSRIPFPKEDRIGKKYRVEYAVDTKEELLYQFYEGESRLADPLGKAFYSKKKYGEGKDTSDLYALLDIKDFDWKGTKNPRIPYDRLLIYCLHARGFTKHVSSGVKARGTFSGVIEKIPYLKSIGVTTLEFQPVCEFIEKPAKNQGAFTVAAEGLATKEEQRLNYWGYAKAYYLAPKADYAFLDPVTECKEMIRALHEAGMEAVFQFYFPKEINPMLIPQVLHYWVEEYHVDGFHLIGENLPSELIARDPELSETKLWYYQFDADAIYGRRSVPKQKTLGLLRDDFMFETRRFLKGDENLVSAMMRHLRSVPASLSQINYLTTYWGFTLMDMVSYDFKHNEANGEENHDGTDYNCSWNCGEEGASRKKKIRALRLTQIKNALCMLFFAQGTPRIFMGDEFGNSQKGNNNPYCQDNEVTWLNWTNIQKNEEILDFFKKLVALRRDNPILRPGKEAQMMDSISCGYPDLSFHGETAWRPQFENYSRQLGVMYCGLYDEKNLGAQGNAEVKKSDEKKDFLYLAMNMHWEPHRLGLPRLPKGRRWKIELCTCETCEIQQAEADFAVLPAKSVALFVDGEDLTEKKTDEEKDQEKEKQ